MEKRFNEIVKKQYVDVVQELVLEVDEFFLDDINYAFAREFPQEAEYFTITEEMVLNLYKKDAPRTEFDDFMTDFVDEWLRGCLPYIIDSDTYDEEIFVR